MFVLSFQAWWQCKGRLFVLILYTQFIKPLNLFPFLNGKIVLVEVTEFGFLYLFPLSTDTGTYLPQCAENKFHAQERVFYLSDYKVFFSFFLLPAFFSILPASFLAALLAIFVEGLWTMVTVEFLQRKLTLAVRTNTSSKICKFHGCRLIIS